MSASSANPIPTKPNDFWRSGVGATELPDGINDTTEIIRRDGNIGINTDPESAMHASGAGAPNTVHTVFIANNPIPFGGNGNFGAAIAFSNSEGFNSLSKVMARVGGRNSVVGTSNGGDLVFETRTVATLSEKAVIKDNGNFGVGTTTPTEKLHLFGNPNQNIMLESPTGGSTFNLLKVRTWSGMAANTYVGFGGTDDGATSARASIYVPNAANTGVFEAVSVVKATGNFGIGVVAPHSKLHVNGTQAGSTAVITANTTLGLTHHKVVVNNAAANITITFPDPLTCIGREYIISRYAGSTGTISLNSIGVTQIQTLTGTIVGVGSIAAHSATGGGLNHSFTAVNVGGVGVWVRI